MNGYFSKETLKQSEELSRKWEDEVRIAGRGKMRTRAGPPFPIWKSNGSTPPRTSQRWISPATSASPGEFPFLRGNQPTGYRGRFWTFRMFSGMGSAKDTNARWHMLLKEGQTGLSTAFDFPTLMGYDSDSPKARGECGRCGVAIDTLDDFLTLMEGIPMDQVTTSMTINPPATALWAMYCAAAEIKGVPLDGDRRNDPERHAQGVHRPEDLHVSRRSRRCG